MSGFDQLSDDAKLMVAGHFSFGSKTRLTFQTPWNLTPRATAGLAEAVKAGLLTHVVGEDGLYAHTYRPVDDIPEARHWASRNMSKGKGFVVMVPDAERLERPPSDWPVPAGFKRHPQ